jgi:hypothetical protein
VLREDFHIPDGRDINWQDPPMVNNFVQGLG